MKPWMRHLTFGLFVGCLIFYGILSMYRFIVPVSSPPAKVYDFAEACDGQVVVAQRRDETLDEALLRLPVRGGCICFGDWPQKDFHISIIPTGTITILGGNFNADLK